MCEPSLRGSTSKRSCGVAARAYVGRSRDRPDSREQGERPTRVARTPTGNDAEMRGADQARSEFDDAYPYLVAVAFDAIQNFFRYDGSVIATAVAETLADT